jgi:small subunit ribosomal protein S20
MANHYSALKRMRQTEKRTERNRAAKTRLRHTIRELRRTLSQDGAKAQQLLPSVVSVIDKSVKKGIIKENTASRYKSRLALRVRKAAVAKPL